jgi:hypothetical protein
LAAVTRVSILRLYSKPGFEFSSRGRGVIGKQNELAAQAIGEIRQVWQVDADRMQTVGDPDHLDGPGYGFDWWPGDFKVEVRAQAERDFKVDLRDRPMCRLSVTTDFLSGVDMTQSQIHERLAVCNRLSPTFALVSPVSITAASDKDLQSGDIRLASTAYFHAGVPWLPHFFAGATILQPIEAQFHADLVAGWLGGVPNRSRLSTAPRAPDDMLGLVGDVYAPVGRWNNRWVGTGEFEAIVERWGKSDVAFGFGDHNGILLTTPFGEDLALVQLRTDQPHQDLGNGLFALLVLPFRFAAAEACEIASTLNHLEARYWTGSQAPPLIGAWSPTDGGCDEGIMQVAHGMFIPNLLYQIGIAENIALQLIARARWVRRALWPRLTDLPMFEILDRRLSEWGHSGLA